MPIQRTDQPDPGLPVDPSLDPLMTPERETAFAEFLRSLGQNPLRREYDRVTAWQSTAERHREAFREAFEAQQMRRPDDHRPDPFKEEPDQ